MSDEAMDGVQEKAAGKKPARKPAARKAKPAAEAETAPAVAKLTVAERLEARKLEMMELEYEKLADDIAKIRAGKVLSTYFRENAEAGLKKAAEERLAREANCSHKKAGKDDDGFRNGNSSNYSVNKNTYPWGATEVMCTRCNKIVAMPPKSYKLENPEDYAERVREYKEWMKYPTDNSPSGSQLFGVIGREALLEAIQ